MEGAACRAAAASQVAACRVGFPVLAAPEAHLLFFGAPYPEFPHFLVVADLGLREMPVLPEYDVETQSDKAQPNKKQRCYEYLHSKDDLENETVADRLVIVDLFDDIREGICDGQYCNLALVLVRIAGEGDSVSDYDLLEGRFGYPFVCLS